MSESFEPESRAGIGKQSVGDGSAHAMSHYHHRFAQRKFLFNGVELLPQDSSRVWIRIPTGIAVEPELVIPPDIFVAAQIVQHWHPCGWCVHETMNNKQDGLVRIVRFEARHSGGRGVFLRSEHTGESKLLWLFPGEQHCIGRREVCRERIGISVNAD